jgi:hypothetical protein
LVGQPDSEQLDRPITIPNTTLFSKPCADVAEAQQAVVSPR